MNMQIAHIGKAQSLRLQRLGMGSDIIRCEWAGTDPLYVAYHDDEWGVPVYDDRELWERLMLEGFQAGLAWITILRKRESFLAAFDGWDPDIIAAYGGDDIARLRMMPGSASSRAMSSSP